MKSNNYNARNQIPEFVRESTMSVEIQGDDVKITGQCGKGYKTSVVGFRELNRRVEKEISATRIKIIEDRIKKNQSQLEYDEEELSRLTANDKSESVPSL